MRARCRRRCRRTRNQPLDHPSSVSGMAAPLANVFTLGAREFPRLCAFYDALDWPVVFDDLAFVANGLREAVVCLFPVARLAEDGRAEPEQTRGGTRFTNGIMPATPDDVHT